MDPKVLPSNTSLPHGPSLQDKRWDMAQGILAGGSLSLHVKTR